MNIESKIVLNVGKPVTFSCKNSLLYGMLHRPIANSFSKDTGIILLNPGPADRVGPHRLYAKLAHRFSSYGYSVLRFDARGVGESEGEWENGIESSSINNIFTRIQQGAWISDAHAAIEFMIQNTGVRRVVIGGLCGGAITALVAGAKHASVAGMFLIGAPVTISANMTGIADFPKETIKKEANRYYLKLFRPSAWLRFLTLKTDYNTLLGVLSSQLRSSLQIKKKKISSIHEKVNPYFLTGLKSSIAEKKRLMLIYSEEDYLWQEFKEYFLANWIHYQSEENQLNTIPEANHTLTGIKMQDDLFRIISSWLDASFPKDMPY